MQQSISLPIASHALLMLALSGCFVSQDLVDKASDKDGDGVMVGDDCDDNDDTVTGPVEWYGDIDGDGFGAGELLTACPGERPTTNTADNADDCDDSNPSAYPGAEERYYDGVDQDCAGEDADGNGSVDDFDQDGDGWEQDLDCDDTDPDLRPDPSLTEVHYDGIENDCDLSTGDGDKDGDGFWSSEYAAKARGSTLSAPDGFTGDCYDDVDDPEQDVSRHNGLAAPSPENVHPGTEFDAPYDGVDADCGGDAGEFDADGDGFASQAYPDRAGDRGDDCQDCTSACAREPDWSSEVASDGIHPDAPETWYDGVDQDCLGTDSNSDGTEDDFDADSDGYTAKGYISSTGRGDDCIDTDATTHPDATDTWYDGVDTDCDGSDDYDADYDGYILDDDFGKATAGVDGWVQLPAGDCVDDPVNDGMAFQQDASDYNPAQADVWYDGWDHDCGGDDDFDFDGDGHRSDFYAGSDTSTAQQDTVIHTASSADNDDCDDSDSLISPSVAEVASNGIDDNCDGAAAPEGIQGTNTPTDHASGAVIGSGAGFGYAIASGDVDGDGVPDLVVGTDSYSGTVSNAGAVATYSGTDLLGAELGSTDYILQMEGLTASGLLGEAVTVGDVDGDGYDDMIVSEPRNADGSGNSDGAAYIFFGPTSATMASPWTGKTSSTDVDLTLQGTQGAYLGMTRGLGTFDADQDGVAEVLMGGMYLDAWGGFTSRIGGIYIFDADASGTVSDSSASVVYGNEAYDYFGTAVSQTDGDMDGDGNREIAVGGQYSSDQSSFGGAAYVWEAPIQNGSTADQEAITKFEGNASSAYCGSALAMGDLDSDGYDDLVVGCYGYNSNNGLVAIIYGRSRSPLPSTSTPDSSDAVILGVSSSTYEQLGYSVSVGDVSGDGSTDLLVGGRYFSSPTVSFVGRVSLFEGGGRWSGYYAPSTADGFVEGDAYAGYLGTAVDASSDFDADGTNDILIGRNGVNLSGSSGGDVVLFTGGSW